MLVPFSLGDLWATMAQMVEVHLITSGLLVQTSAPFILVVVSLGILHPLCLLVVVRVPSGACVWQPPFSQCAPRPAVVTM